jgi:hypothetical protein
MQQRQREVLLEFVFQGNSVKVTAIDAVTGEEASIVGPASARKSDLEAAAVRTLRYIGQRYKPL